MSIILANRFMVVALILSLLLCACASAPTATPIPATTAPTTAPVTGAQAVTALASATRTPLPSVTPTPSLVIPPPQPTQQNAQATAVPAATKVPAATQTTAPSPTSPSALLALTPVMGMTPLASKAALLPGVPPPLDIQLPPGWQYGYSVVPVRDPFVEASMNMALYTGPVKNGKGTIIVRWGCPSIGAPPSLAVPLPTASLAPGATPIDQQTQFLWSDGIRLLQGTIVDISCNVGRYDQQFFKIGGKDAVGAYFNASQCADIPDTVGWFAGLNQYGGNFLFY